MPSPILKTLLVVLACLIAADVVGALACTLFDILDFTSNSPALSYAIWLVLGGFCGLIAYNVAGAWSSPKGRWGDWSSAPGSKGIGTVILIVTVLVVVALAGLFYALIWTQGVAGDDYVPDSEPHSLVFFVAVLAGVPSAGS